MLLLALGSVGFECGSPVNANTGFDLWCGDALCGWSVDKGDVERVSTWHERDYAALLIGPEVELTQVVVPDTGPCGGLGLGFEDGTTPHDLDVRLLGSAEPGTTVSFEADDDEDGTIDYRQDLPSVWPEWADVGGTIVPPPRQGGRPVVLRVRKVGEGQAAIAQVVIWDSCAW